MWFLVHVPGMNGPNTRGLLGKGLSAPVTTAVFGPFIPGTCICHTITQSCIKRAMFERGIYEKAGPWAEKVH